MGRTFGMVAKNDGAKFEARPLIECEECGEVIDLFQFPGFREDGCLFWFVNKTPLINGLSCASVEKFVNCPKCESGIFISKISG